MSIYFLFFKKNASNLFLGGLLAVLSIRVWKSIFFYFNQGLSLIYLQIGLSACFFIGPFLYLYIKSVIAGSKYKARNSCFLLLGLLLLVVVVGFLYPYEQFPILWSGYFYKTINYQWLTFILASGYLLRNRFRKIEKASLNNENVWLLSVYFGVFVIWLAYFTSSYTSYIMGALSFSFALYLSSLLVFHHRKKSSLDKKEKYANHKIPLQEADELLEKVTQLLEEEALYKDPNLTLAQLAKALSIRPHLLSQLLNDNLNKSFSHFINEFRVREAIELLKSNRNLKMEIIAEMCGFNSNSTFYAAFKKVTNTTPAKYADNGPVLNS
ncbi:helix-turn-helix transcriptional regulator [Fulvivirga sp. 29W222]|uniref:Helix-turn-helix transcriptional regulator n=1 Tax=Fulvivirga marina TaxID=2494733 RepID=A0A937G075_9BACT|nr:response regulator transcription factor [Fulvivirga marina]MBL6448138.1 helix-turn-helix transcriptional regulator [Fulvivirga marina]